MADATPIRERLTLAAFRARLALPENRDRRLELVDGEVVEKMASQLHNRISRNLFRALDQHAQAHDLGEVEYETSCHAPGDESNFRIPDLSFTSKARLLPVRDEGPVPQIPDLCIEIQSPDDYPREMREKAAYYLANGAQQVWLLFTRRPRLEVMYPDGDSDFYNLDDTLTSDLLPGFSIPIADLFRV